MNLDLRTANWRAAALELIPFAAPPLLAGAIAFGVDELVFGAIALSIAAGLGWWRIDRIYVAMFVFAGRGFVFLLLLSWAIGEQVSNDINANYFPDEHEASALGETLLAAAAAFFVVTTLASATAVAFVSRHHSAAGTMQAEA